MARSVPRRDRWRAPRCSSGAPNPTPTSRRNGCGTPPRSCDAKPVMLDVIRHERQKFYDLVDDPANWNVQSRCTEWETRDLVGHMIDVTEGYLERWAIARQGGTGENYGL